MGNLISIMTNYILFLFFASPIKQNFSFLCLIKTYFEAFLSYCMSLKEEFKFFFLREFKFAHVRDWKKNMT